MIEEFIPFASIFASIVAGIATWVVARKQFKEAEVLEKAMRSLEEENGQYETVFKKNVESLRNQVLKSLEDEKGRSLTEFQKNAEVVKSQIAFLAKRSEELSKDGSLDYAELLFLLRQMDEIQSGAKQSVLEHAKSTIPAKQH